MVLSSADLGSLMRRPKARKRLLDEGTAMFMRLSSKVGDEREAVRIQAMEAWEMFARSMVPQCSSLNLSQARIA